MFTRFRSRTLIVLFAVLATAGTGAATQAFPSVGVFALQESTPEVIRTVLMEDAPESAPGEEMELARYEIPAGIVLPHHTHPGVQMTTVLEGTLTYFVVADGTATVTRADGTQLKIGPGETVELTAGDSILEPEGMVHYGENRTESVIVLISASLFEEGEPVSSVVEASPVATPAS